MGAGDCFVVLLLIGWMYEYDRVNTDMINVDYLVKIYVYPSRWCFLLGVCEGRGGVLC